jgi:hypothetical protein
MELETGERRNVEISPEALEAISQYSATFDIAYWPAAFLVMAFLLFCAVFKACM